MSPGVLTSKIDFFDNDSLIAVNDLSISKLTMFRIKSFIQELIRELGEDINAFQPIMKETIRIALGIIPLKQKYNATLYEISLAAFWLVLRNRGFGKYTLQKLVCISRKKLRKRILLRRLISILSDVRLSFQELDAKEEIKKLALHALPRLLRHYLVTQRIERVSYLDLPAYLRVLKLHIYQLLASLRVQDTSGRSRTVLAAICIYIADKLACKQLNIRPLISAKALEETLGISQFTILRHYKEYFNRLS
ncbi:MAG: cyclin family protein [Candidatus Njordarchaeales archaeon]